MKTITFYSYKGGVGRTLALSNIAIRLSEFKKKVCVLDFDLEAPGLHFKFKNYTPSKPLENGIVDYIHSFSHDSIIPKNIKDYSVTLDPGNKIFTSIELIPAGNIDDSAYWQKLSKINWSEMFYSENSQGVAFFLDLKAKIEKEYKPDFLLIDSRTGITDMSGITLRLLADDVVIIAANNEENIYGSKKIIKSLLLDNNHLISAPKIHFVLTRIPFTDSSSDRIKETKIIDRRKRELSKELQLKDIEINVIHSDRRLEENEQLLIGDDYEEKTVSISNDYLNLFDKLTSGFLSSEEISIFKNKKLAEKEFNKAKVVEGFTLKLAHLEKAVELDANKYEYYRELGDLFFDFKDYHLAEKNYKKAILLSPNSAEMLNYLGVTNLFLKKNETALEWYNKCLVIDPINLSALYNKSSIYIKQGNIDEGLRLLNHILELDPYLDIAYNARADLNRKMNKLKVAYKDVYKAIELNDDQAIYFATLAEICSADGKIEEFYFNLNLALSKELDPIYLDQTKDIYEKYIHEERFINLLNKYDIDPDDIFQEN